MAPTHRPPVKPGKPLDILRAQNLAQLPWLVHGFSTRGGGISTCYGGNTLNLGLTQHDTKENVEHNCALFLEKVGAIDPEGYSWPLIQLRQIHSSVVHGVSAASGKPLAGDGLVTDTANLLLAVRTADCVPILLVDARRRVVGAIHAGWRGTVRRVVEKGIGEMRRRFDSVPRDLRAAIGPCIRRCCYQVGAEVRAQFESQFSYSDQLFHEIFDANALRVRYPLLFLNQRASYHSDLGPEIHLDLVEANRRQLQDAGIREEYIRVVEGCTACQTTRFFSHRAEFGQTGRLMAVIGIRSE
jgi:polyphenol oxidase